MYEPKHHKLLTHAEFYARMAMHLGVAILLLAFSLVIGMIGYVSTEGVEWIDAFLNSAMLLGGMGEVDPLKTSGGKLFAGCYALYAGLVFIVCVAIVLTPVIHRVMHHFHVGEKD